MQLKETPSTRMWRGRALPESGRPAGYAALIDHFDLNVPPPARPAFIADRNHPDSSQEWLIVSGKRPPDSTVSAHLEFAIKQEGVDLSVLHALFQVLPVDVLIDYITSAPLGRYTRRIWYLYEWLTGKQLDIPDLDGRPTAVDVLDTSQQVGLPEGMLSTRHRVRDNLPGTPLFCPTVRWTDALRHAVHARWDERAREALGRVRPDILSRAAAFLLLSDSRSSFEIEGERPSPDRARRWGRAIAEAGDADLDIPALERLQKMVIGDDRLVQLGLRRDGGFVGHRDRFTNDPVPEHISARAEDLPSLIEGLIRFSESTATIDPVIRAAMVSFGFVYIHPFSDGNGRLHRWLIHHVLAKADYHPTGVPFPISAAMLRNVDAYRRVLESWARPLLACIDWMPTEQKNIQVVGDTAHFYRYFDATAHAEFLYACVRETVEQDLVEEVAFLEAFDAFSDAVQQIIDMPRDTVHLLHNFLHQNGGQLSARARSREFSRLTPEEISEIESIYAEAHGKSR